MRCLGSRIVPGRSGTSFVLAGALLLVIAGCVSSPTDQRPVAQPPAAPEPLLLNTGPLDIPADCRPARGAVYRTSYLVQPDGRVAGAASESGEGCVQDALRRWVYTFEYRPAGSSTPTVLDWMAVTASRGG